MADQGGIRVHRKRQQPFAAIDHQVARNGQLSDKALRLYVVLQSHADWSDGRSWPTLATVAKEMGCHRSSVTRAQTELEQAGLLEIESGKDRGQPNTYVLVDPEPAPGVHHPRATGTPPTRQGGDAPVQHPYKQEPGNKNQEPEPPSLLNPVEDRAHPDYGFERFWQRYPRRDGRRGSRAKALALWRKLTYEQKSEAWRQLGEYLKIVAAGRPAMDAERWLRTGNENSWNPAEGWRADHPSGIQNGPARRPWADYTEEEYVALYSSLTEQERNAADDARRRAANERRATG